MNFREMDPDEVRKLLEGHKDILGGESAKEQAFFRMCMCPSCQSYEHEQFLDPKRLFAPGAVLPTKYLRCIKCGTEWEPHTRLVTKVPSDAGEVDPLT